MQRSPSKSSGLHRLVVVLEGEPFGEPGVTHILGEFPLLTQDVVLEGLLGKTRACRSMRARVRRFSKAEAASLATSPPHLGRFRHVLEENRPPSWFCTFESHSAP